MPIGIEGNYIVELSVGDEFQDFLKKEDLIQIETLEQVGHALPTIRMQFESSDERLISALNEANEINLSMGKTSDSLLDCRVATIRLVVSESGRNKRKLEISGVLSNVEYTNNTSPRIYHEKTSLEVVSELAELYGLELVTNIESTNDKMSWAQAGQTGQNFFKKVSKHAFIDSEGSFISTALTIDNEIRFCNL